MATDDQRQGDELVPVVRVCVVVVVVRDIKRSRSIARGLAGDFAGIPAKTSYYADYP
jgi:hypothetical protein